MPNVTLSMAIADVLVGLHHRGNPCARPPTIIAMSKATRLFSGVDANGESGSPRPRRSFAMPKWSTGAQCVARSEEHTSELQSLMRISYAVFCLKKQTKQKNKT